MDRREKRVFPVSEYGRQSSKVREGTERQDAASRLRGSGGSRDRRHTGWGILRSCTNDVLFVSVFVRFVDLFEFLVESSELQESLWKAVFMQISALF